MYKREHRARCLILHIQYKMSNDYVLVINAAQLLISSKNTYKLKALVHSINCRLIRITHSKHAFWINSKYMYQIPPFCKQKQKKSLLSMLNLLLVKISFLAHKMIKYHVILKIISSYDQQYIYLKKSVLIFQFILSVFSNCRDFF